MIQLVRRNSKNLKLLYLMSVLSFRPISSPELTRRISLLWININMSLFLIDCDGNILNTRFSSCSGQWLLIIWLNVEEELSLEMVGWQLASWLNIELLWLFHMPGGTCACTQNIHTNLAQNLEWVMVRPLRGYCEWADIRTCYDSHRVLFSQQIQMWLITILWWIHILIHGKVGCANTISQIFQAAM